MSSGLGCLRRKRALTGGYRLEGLASPRVNKAPDVKASETHSFCTESATELGDQGQSHVRAEHGMGFMRRVAGERFTHSSGRRMPAGPDGGEAS